MISEETRRKLRELNLSEIISALELQQEDNNYISMSFDERFQRVVDYLYQEKYNSKIQRMIKQAKFRLPRADVVDVYYENREINKDSILELSTCQFVASNTDVIFQGFTGSGKTFLACAIGKQACKKGIRTKYVRLPDLLEEYDISKNINRTGSKILKKYSGFKLLIIDEWLFEDVSEEEQRFIFELTERRHDCTSTIFCTQYRREDWHSRLGGDTHADAIMDRIVHNSVWVETGTMNMREYCAKHKI